MIFISIDYSNLPFAKPSHNRREAKRGAKSKFTTKTIQEVFERDKWRCVRCGTYKDLERTSHHITFRSQGGTGEKRNAATVCRACHDLAHKQKEVRQWFETWKEEYLDDEGNYKKTPAILEGDFF